MNALGVITIKKQYNVDLADGDIKANQLVSVIYDGTNFQLLSPISNVASGGGGAIVKVKTAEEIVNNSTTFQDDDHITGITLTANTNYSFILQLQCTTGTTSDIKMHFAF